MLSFYVELEVELSLRGRRRNRGGPSRSRSLIDVHVDVSFEIIQLRFYRPAIRAAQPRCRGQGRGGRPNPHRHAECHAGALRPPRAAARRLSGLVARLGWGLASPGNSRRKKKAKTPWNCNSRDFVNWSEAEKVCVHCSRGLAAATSASHAEGRQLDPGQVYLHEWCWPSVLPI